MDIRGLINNHVIEVPWEYGCDILLEDLGRLAILARMGKKLILPPDFYALIKYDEVSGMIEFAEEYDDRQYPSMFMLFYICSSCERILMDPHDLYICDFTNDVKFVKKYKLYNTRLCKFLKYIGEYDGEGLNDYTV